MTQAPPPQTPNYASADTGPAKNNGLGIAALICGIIAVLIAWIPCVNFFAWILILIALGLGIAGWIGASGKPNQKATAAIIGIVLSVVAAVLFFISWAATGYFAERYGGQATEYLLRTGYSLQADAIAAQAQGAGVDQATIDEARADLDAKLEALAIDLGDETSADRAQQEGEAAVQEFRERLESAAGQSFDVPDVDELQDGTGEVTE